MVAISNISCYISVKAFSRLSPCCFSLLEGVPHKHEHSYAILPLFISLFKFFLCLDANKTTSNSYATSMLVAIRMADLITFFFISFLLFFLPPSDQTHHALSAVVDFKRKLLGTGTNLFFRFFSVPSTVRSLVLT